MAEDRQKPLRLAIYARVSTEEQKEGQTIDSQIAELERFAAERGWTIAGIYKDEGWSGGVLARPQLDRLRDDATRGLFDTVLINDVDRLARDVTHLGVVKRDLERKGVQVMFRKLPSESSPTHNLMVNILGSFAEFEREMIVDRTRRGRLHKIEVRQKYLGGNTSYGYRYIPMERAAGKEGILEIAPEEAAVVRQMFAWVDQEGLSARQVLNRLNERKITPRKGAAKWAKSSVLRILHKEMYVGTWHYNKFESFEPAAGPIAGQYRKHVKSGKRQRPVSEWIRLELPESLRVIDRKQWKRVQEQLQRNIAFSPRHEKHSYFLKSLIRCAGCGARYVGEPGHGKFYYRCIARCKRCPTVREEVLNTTIWDAIENAILHPELIVDQVAKWHQNQTASAEQNQSELSNIERDLQHLQTEEARLLEAYRIGIITPAQLGSELEKLGSRRKSIETRRDQVTEQSIVPAAQIRESVQDYCRLAAETIRTFTHAEKQRFIRTVVKNIVFDGSQARIQGAIPIGGLSEQSSDPEHPAPQDDDSVGRIATPMADRHGRNLGRENLYCHSTLLNGNRPLASSFEIATEIVRLRPWELPRDKLGRFKKRLDPRYNYTHHNETVEQKELTKYWKVP